MYRSHINRDCLLIQFWFHLFVTYTETNGEKRTWWLQTRWWSCWRSQILFGRSLWLDPTKNLWSPQPSGPTDPRCQLYTQSCQISYTVWTLNYWGFPHEIIKIVATFLITENLLVGVFFWLCTHDLFGVPLHPRRCWSSCSRWTGEREAERSVQPTGCTLSHNPSEGGRTFINGASFNIALNHSENFSEIFSVLSWYVINRCHSTHPTR